MIAKETRETILNLMGQTLDLIKVSALGDRQVRQAEIALKNAFNRGLVQLLEKFEALKIIKKCNCLINLLACQDSGEEKRKLFEVKRNCQHCGGSGYIDVVSKSAKRKNSI